MHGEFLSELNPVIQFDTRLKGGHDQQLIYGRRRLDLGQRPVSVATFCYIYQDTVGGVFGAS